MISCLPHCPPDRDKPTSNILSTQRTPDPRETRLQDRHHIHDPVRPETLGPVTRTAITNCPRPKSPATFQLYLLRDARASTLVLNMKQNVPAYEKYDQQYGSPLGTPRSPMYVTQVNKATSLESLKIYLCNQNKGVKNIKECRNTISDHDRLKASLISDELNRPNHRALVLICLLYTSPSPRDRQKSRMPSSA